MRERCNNPKNSSYTRYGEAGITVCDEWKDSFINFYTDMGLKPSPAHTIDRIDGTKGYYRENCRWATKKEQANNLSSNVLIEHLGRNQTLSQWSDELGFDFNLIKSRMRDGRLSLEQAINAKDVVIPIYRFNGIDVRLCDWCKDNSINYKWAFKQIHQYKRTLEDIIKYVNITLDTEYTIDGNTRKLKEWCRLSDIQPADVKRRLMLGWLFEEAINPIAKKLITFNPDNSDKGTETFKLSFWCGLLGLDKEATYLRMIRGANFEDVVKEY